MANNEKILHFANFNITYGPTEEPMLEHFEDIIFPAFICDFRRGKASESPVFYFDGVAIKEIDNEYVLTGNYIKDTQYEIRTTIQDGKLVSTPASVPTAPYSRFIIFLRNHRMVLVRNESVSPDIRSFQKTVREMLNYYIREKNYPIQNKAEKLPQAFVNIVDIPLPDDIDKILKNVQKIRWLSLRFFPLNGDLNTIPVAEDIDKEMKKLGSKHANVKFTSPESKPEVKSLIKHSAGLALATLEVKDSDGNIKKIKEENFTSNKKIIFSRDISPNDDSYIITQAKQDTVVTTVSDENLTLYNRFISAIKALLLK